MSTERSKSCSTFERTILPPSIDENAIAVDDVGFGMFLGGTGDSLEPTGQVVVVSVQPADQVSGSAQEAFVDGIGLAAVGLGIPAHIGMTLDDRSRSRR